MEQLVKTGNKNLIGRIYNGKFNSALKYLEGESKETVELVNTLARLFGNVGWLDGDLGYLLMQ